MWRNRQSSQRSKNAFGSWPSLKGQKVHVGGRKAHSRTSQQGTRIKKTVQAWLSQKDAEQSRELPLLQLSPQSCAKVTSHGWTTTTSRRSQKQLPRTPHLRRQHGYTPGRDDAGGYISGSSVRKSRHSSPAGTLRKQRNSVR